MNSIPPLSVLTESPLIDGHNDLLAALRKRAGYSVEGLEARRHDLHTDIPRLRQGQVGAQFWSVWVPSDIQQDAAVVATLEQVDAAHRLVTRYPRVFGMASTADDVERMFSSGRIASLMGIEGGHSIAESLGALRMFARLGVRYMTLTHNDDTSWAASATGIRQTTGLEDVGRAVVAEMNRIGMIVDLSHTAESTQMDALDVATAPVLFSHSSVRALADHPRNVSDHILSKLGGNGGVVQITFVPEFLTQACADWERDLAEVRVGLGLDAPRPTLEKPTLPLRLNYPAAPRPGESSASARLRNDPLLDLPADSEAVPAQRAALAQWLERHPQPAASLRDAANHIEHARHVAGIDHIGIGGDFDGTSLLPIGLQDVSTYPALFSELGSRGWPEEDLRKLAGQNVLRVMREVEDAAEEPLWPSK